MNEVSAAPQRCAVIDIGTVTCRLLVVDVWPDGRLEEVHRDRAIVNLGEGVDATQAFSLAAMQRAEEAIAEFALAVSALEADGTSIPIVAVGTSACRDATNSQELCDRLAAFGVTLQVIEGQLEAAYSFAGASRGLAGQSILVADIGGGSTELVAGIAGEGVRFSHSFDIGCRRLTERFLTIDPPDPEQMRQARAWYLPQFEGFFEQLADAGFKVESLVAVAGTATSAVSIEQAMKVYDSARVHGYFMPEEALRAVTQLAASMTLEQRKNLVGLEPKRAPVIVAGLMELCDLVALAGTGGFVASESDILHGTALCAF